MSGFDRLKTRMQLSGDSLKKEFIKDAQRLHEIENNNDVSCNDTSFFRWIAGSKPQVGEQVQPRLYSRQYSSANGFTMKFLSLYSEKILVGDLFHDAYDNTYWICTESFDVDRINYKGKLTLCNSIIRFQDDTGIVYEYPCQDINSTSYNTGIEENKTMLLGSTQHMLFLPYDDITVSIRRNKRFFLDRNKVSPTPYKVTQNDTTSYAYDGKGICRLTVTEDTFNENTDRVDLWLCDYLKQEEAPNIPTPTINGYSDIKYKSNPVIKCGGSAKIFTSRYLDNNNIEVSLDYGKIIWTIECDFSENLLNKEVLDNTISFKVTDTSLINKTFKLRLSDTDNLYTASEVLVSIDTLY